MRSHKNRTLNYIPPTNYVYYNGLKIKLFSREQANHLQWGYRKMWSCKKYLQTKYQDTHVSNIFSNAKKFDIDQLQM